MVATILVRRIGPRYPAAWVRPLKSIPSGVEKAHSHSPLERPPVKLTILTKLFGAFAVTLIVVAVVTFVGAAEIGAGANRTEDVKGELEEMSGALDDVRGQGKLLELGEAVAAAEEPDTRAEAEEAFVAQEAKMGKRFEELKAEVLGAGGNTQAGEEGRLAERILTAYRTFDEALNAAIASTSEANEARLTETYDELDDALGDIAATHRSEADGTVDEAVAAAASARRLLLIIAAVGTLAGLAVFVVITRRIVARIHAYTAFTAHVAEGDLTLRVDATGADELAELGTHLNTMSEGMASVSGRVSEGATSLSSSSSQMLATVNQNTASAAEQSAAISQISATVEQVRTSAEQAAERAEQMVETSAQAAERREEGTAAVEAIVVGMGDISTKVDEIAADILALSEQTQQISEITNAVNDIADQSNLLALNATIEAARAGEQGKGFAVVADEVRTLADQSKQATTQVQAILAEIQKATNAAVMNAGQGTTVVKAGMEMAHRAGEINAQLAEANRGAGQAAGQIAAAARQQSAGMDQVAQAMQETSQATTQFEAGARETQSALTGLTSLARDLQEVAGHYRTGT